MQALNETDKYIIAKCCNNAQEVPQCTCEIYIRVYVFTEIMYEVTSLSQIYILRF